jgi:hypothetical protein
MSRTSSRSGQALGPRWPVPAGASSRPTVSLRDGAAAARLAHNQEVGRASRSPATSLSGAHSCAPKCQGRDGYYRGSGSCVGALGIRYAALSTRRFGPAHCRGEPHIRVGLRLAAEGPHCGKQPAAAQSNSPTRSAPEVFAGVTDVGGGSNLPVATHLAGHPAPPLSHSYADANTREQIAQVCRASATYF